MFTFTFKVKKLLKTFCWLCVLYILYAFVFGVLLFRFIPPTEGIVNEPLENNRLYQNDRVVLLEDGLEAGIARLHLIENAQETIDIAYHTIHDGEAANIFFASLLEAADRGVQVRVLLDGLMHNFSRSLKDISYSFTEHPNIELMLYEPFQMWKPWTWNNRLHDKFIVADQEMVILGGRNIGDKYFTSHTNAPFVKDRDVLIFREGAPSESVVHEINQYFETVWTHPFTKNAVKSLSYWKEEKGARKAEQLKTDYSQIRYHNNDFLFKQTFDWKEKSVSVDNMRLIHNPLQLYNKEPIIWKELMTLFAKADSVFIQSPYVIPTEKMLSYLPEMDEKEIQVLTNSMAATPNTLAFSGYYNKRKRLVHNGVDVFEYQGPDSLHAKTVIIDDRISVIGSFNIDARSTFLSTETMIVIESESFASLLKDEVDTLLSNSLQVKEDLTYVDNDGIPEADVSITKKWVIRGVAFLTRKFDYLL